MEQCFKKIFGNIYLNSLCPPLCTHNPTTDEYEFSVPTLTGGYFTKLYSGEIPNLQKGINGEVFKTLKG